MDEKRLFERFEISVPVRIEIMDGEEEPGEIALETNNLSAGGLFIETGKPLPEGAQVRLKIILYFEELRTAADPEGALVIAATGYIQRSDPEGTAICFHDDYDVTTPLDFLEQEPLESHQRVV